MFVFGPYVYGLRNRIQLNTLRTPTNIKNKIPIFAGVHAHPIYPTAQSHMYHEH